MPTPPILRPTLIATALIATALIAAPPLAAQTLPPQDAQRLMPIGPGLCGQSMALTWMATTPIDIAPMIPLELELARFEPAWLQFVLATPGTVTMTTGTTDPDADPFLTVYDQTGNPIDWDDDGGVGWNALLTVDLPAGAYCAQVRMIAREVQPAAAVTLDLQMGGTAPAPAPSPTPDPVADGSAFIPGLRCSDPATTTALGVTAPGFGTVRVLAEVPRGDERHFIVEAPAGIGVQVTARSTDFDTMLQLYDVSGRLLDENDDYPGMGTDSRIDADLAAGVYCVGLRGFGGSGGTAELALTEVAAMVPPPGAAFDPAGPCGDPATPSLGLLGAGASLSDATRSVPAGGRSDWTLVLDAPMEVQIDAASTEFDTILTLFDQRGGMMAENDDFPGLGTDSRLVEELSPGTYCLGVRGFGGGGGALVLTAQSLAAAAPAPTPAPTPAPPAAPVAQDVTSGSDFAGPGGMACTEAARTGDFGSFDVATAPRNATVRIPPGGRADWRLTTTAPLDLRLTAESPEFDTVLSLYDAGGVMLAENDDAPGGGTTDSLLDWRLEAGSHCITLRGFGSQGGTGTVQVALAGAASPAVPPLAPAPQPGGLLPGAGETVEDLGALTDRLEASALPGPARWWVAFEVAQPGAVRIDAINLGRGFTASLVDEAGSVITDAGGRGGFTPVVLRPELAAGRYLLLIAPDDASDRAPRRVTILRD